jgi:uncharacterized membrane protein
MAPPADERPHGGIVERVLGRVLGFMDRPWKAVAVIALLIVLGVGFGLWEARHEIIPRLFKDVRPLALNSDVSGELDDIIANTKADLVLVWAVDLANNTVRLIDARQRGGGAWVFTPRRLPAIEAGTDPDTVAKLSRGTSVCADPAQRSSLLQRRFAADGMRWDCAIPVPPSHAQPLIGLLYLGWKERPDAVSEETALTVAGDAAEHMVMR